MRETVDRNLNFVSLLQSYAQEREWRQDGTEAGCSSSLPCTSVVGTHCTCIVYLLLDPPVMLSNLLLSPCMLSTLFIDQDLLAYLHLLNTWIAPASKEGNYLFETEIILGYVISAWV